MTAVGEGGWREERRTRIREAAARVFSAKAFSDASMDDIAREAGVGKPTLYRYYDSKDALFGAVFLDVLDGLEGRLRRVLAGDGSTREVLGAMLGEVVPTFREHLVPLRYLGDAHAGADRSRRRVFRERRVRIAACLEAALDRGAARAELRPGGNSRAVAQMMIGMVWSATAGTGLSDPAIVDLMTGLVFDGLSSAPAGADERPRSPLRLVKASA